MRYSLVAAAAVFFVGAFGWHEFSIRKDSAQAQSIEQSCASPQGFVIQCAIDHLVRLALERDLGVAFHALQQLYAHEPQFAAKCGFAATELGRRIFEANPDYMSLSLTPETIFCNFGFYQSYAEHMLAANKDFGFASPHLHYFYLYHILYLVPRL